MPPARGVRRSTRGEERRRRDPSPCSDDSSLVSEYTPSADEPQDSEGEESLAGNLDEKLAMEEFSSDHDLEDEPDELWDPDQMQDEDADGLMCDDGADGADDGTADPDDEDLFDGNTQPPEYYREGLKNINEAHYMRKQYSPTTLGRLRYIKTQWARYCEKILQEDWRACFKKLRLGMVIQFVKWHLNQKLSSNGRTKPRLRAYGSLINFWLMFRLVFERAMLRKIDPFVDGRHMRNAIREISTKRDLHYQKRANRSMTIRDLLVHIDTTLRTSKKNFKLGEQRVLAVLFFLLLAPAGARPSSILQLRFRDIRVTLARDPLGGHPRLLIEFKLVHVKAYLDPKDTKTFLIPEIIWEPTFMLSPHVFLLGILVRHRAFFVESLNDNIENLAKLQIHPAESELPIPLKREFDDLYIFRSTERNHLGDYQLLNQPISLSKITKWVERVGQLAGFKDNTINYQLRYYAANSMDQNVNISESLRNLVMGHAPNSDTFQKHYLNRNVCADLWAVHRELEPQQQLVRQATSHGHSRSQRRPVDLAPDQVAALKTDPKLMKMTKTLESYPRRSVERRALRLKTQALYNRLYKEKLDTVRKEWTDKQAVEDIEWQLKGNRVDELMGPERDAPPPPHPVQAKMLDALKETVETDFQQQLKRRANAVAVIARYCAVQESGGRTNKVEQAPAPPEELQLKPQDRDQQLRASVFVGRGRDQEMRRCFVCVAKALTLPTDDPWYANFCRQFFSSSEVNRHFKRTHLKAMKPAQKTVCPICTPKVFLRHKAHFQNHAEQVHGLKS